MAQINLENLPEVINNKMDRDGLNASATFDGHISISQTKN